MAYNPYGGPPYGRPPPSFPAFPGTGGGPPGMMPPPGLGPPPGMSSAPGMGPPPGIVQPQTPPTQANRPSGMPPFQPPPNLPNINFNAAVIRLGASSLPSKPQGAPSGPGGPGPGGRRDPETPLSAGGADRGGVGGGRPGHGHGHERNIEQARASVRESMHSLMQPTAEEKLRTIFVHKIPEGVGGEEGIQRILGAAGKLRRWDSIKSQLSDHKGVLFGFAQYEDAESLATAVDLLKDVKVPTKKQEPTEAEEDGKGAENSEKNGEANDPAEGEAAGAKIEGAEADATETEAEAVDKYEGIHKVTLPVVVDEASTKYLEHIREGWSDKAKAEAEERLAAARKRLDEVLEGMFRPRVKPTKDGDGDVAMGEAPPTSGDVEVVNIALAQDDELAEIPAEMREVVAAEIAAFRERSNQRDLERLRKEEEWEEMERRRNGDGGRRIAARLESPQPDSNHAPLGPRVPNAPSGPRGQNGTGGRGLAFVNGGAVNGDGQHWRDEDDTDASDEELHRRAVSAQKAEEEKLYLEAERKWTNRERARQGALDREQERDRADVDNAARRKAEQLERDRGWDDEREASRKSHLYYRDRGAWARKRALDLGDERARDDADRRAERDERRKEEALMEQARGMADSFLEQQEREMEQEERQKQQREEEEEEELSKPAPAPQRLAISFGAAAQKAQTQRAPPAARRTFAEVEGLLDDEEQDQGTKRQLVPITFDAAAEADAPSALTEEEVQKAVRALAQEIPTDREGLWAWDVKWDYMEESIIRDKLRPFVEKKVVEYLGVQEEILVDVVVEHLRGHGKPAALVEELEGALDEDGEDLVKKLWRMVIFFTESEKRGLPA